MIGLILVCVTVAVLVNLFPLVRVCGDSMLPCYRDGDILVSIRLCALYRKLFIKPGCVYVVTPPRNEEHREKYAIKRLRGADYPNNHFYVHGDNASISYDSRFYGPLKMKDFTCKVLFRLKKGGK